MTDPIADMLTRVRNALAVKKPEVVLPYSKIKHEIARILKKEGYLSEVEKPGRRVYVAKDKIPYILNDLGLAILSTSRGLMTNKQARRAKIGGELMFEIW